MNHNLTKIHRSWTNDQIIASSESASCQLTNIVYCSHENPSQAEKLDKINPDTNLIKYEDLSSDTPLSAPTVVGSDLAVIMYTSGTTGKWFTFERTTE